MDWSCIVLGRQDVIVRNACRAGVTETDIMFNIISLHSALSRGGMLISLGFSFMARCTVLLYLESEQGSSQEQPYFLMDLSSVFGKKVGDFNKKGI